MRPAKEPVEWAVLEKYLTRRSPHRGAVLVGEDGR